ncbi:MAG: thiamine phosphate synthase [Candidatus Gygaella obscura]|nr:thiamine phosphate synthase [Candidatus Gygaella obscura]
MKSKKNLLSSAKLYVLIDTKICKNPFLTAKTAVLNGVDMLQLRSYNFSDSRLLELAKKIRRICASYNCLFIINNRADIAYLCKADGVHLGQADIEIKNAKSIMSKKAIFGSSCHSKKELKKAINDRFDYVSAGPVFKTRTKAEYKPIGIKNTLDIFNNKKISTFAIGGITRLNLITLTKKGINKIALCEEVCKTKNIKSTIKLLKKKLN